MRLAVIPTLLSGLVLAVFAAIAAAGAQSGLVSPTISPKLGQLQVRAYQPIPKAKVAVQLSSDSSLARDLRREVMIRLSQRGNEVGFSGGNVMRMDVSYIDLGTSRPFDNNTMVGPPSYESGGSNPRQDLPQNRIERRDTLPPAPTGSTLRITLTLYNLDSGKVLWFATTSCNILDRDVRRAGEIMVDMIFDQADHDRIADAGCPL